MKLNLTDPVTDYTWNNHSNASSNVQYMNHHHNTQFTPSNNININTNPMNPSNPYTNIECVNVRGTFYYYQNNPSSFNRYYDPFQQPTSHHIRTNTNNQSPSSYNKYAKRKHVQKKTHGHGQRMNQYQFKIKPTTYYTKITLDEPTIYQPFKPTVTIHRKTYLLTQGFTRYVPNYKVLQPFDIIKLIAQFYGNIRNTQIITTANCKTFSIIDYKCRNATTYKPSMPSSKSKARCFGRNIDLPHHIINAYNNQHDTDIDVHDRFNILFGLPGNNSTNFHAKIFNEDTAFEVNIPSYRCLKHLKSSKIDTIYSDKYGLICMSDSHWCCFSLYEWKWKCMHHFGGSHALAYRIGNVSSYVMLDEDTVFKTTPKTFGCLIVNCDTFEILQTKAKHNVSHTPAICYDDVLHNRVYIVGKTSSAKYMQYDVVKDDWRAYKGSRSGGEKCQLIWLDDINKNLLYKCSNYGNIGMLDLRINKWNKFDQWTALRSISLNIAHVQNQKIFKL